LIAPSIVAKRSPCIFLKFAILARGAVGITIASRKHAWEDGRARGRESKVSGSEGVRV
jgi:hypothetical protein